MSGVDWTQVSIGVACVAMVGYVLIKIIPSFAPSKTDKEAFTQVIENNTRAIDQLSTILQVSFTRQEAKIDEVVAYVRRMRTVN